MSGTAISISGHDVFLLPGHLDMMASLRMGLDKELGRSSLKTEAHIPPLLGVAPLGPVPLSKDHQFQYRYKFLIFLRDHLSVINLIHFKELAGSFFRNFYSQPVFRIWDPVLFLLLDQRSGTRIRDGKKNPDPRSGMDIPDYFSESLETV
jgi:hypothetical protein